MNWGVTSNALRDSRQKYYSSFVEVSEVMFSSNFLTSKISTWVATSDVVKRAQVLNIFRLEFKIIFFFLLFVSTRQVTKWAFLRFLENHVSHTGRCKTNHSFLLPHFSRQIFPSCILSLSLAVWCALASGRLAHMMQVAAWKLMAQLGCLPCSSVTAINKACLY